MVAEKSWGKFLIYNDKINLRSPPTETDLSSIFRFIWDHGVGNRFDSSGNPIPWSGETLEFAFDSLGQTVDRRSIQNWLSGKNIPTRRNLYVLSRIVSGDDEDLKREWSDALIAGRHKAKQQRKTSSLNMDTALEHKPFIASPASIQPYVKTPLPSDRSREITFIKGLAVFSMLMMAVFLMNQRKINSNDLQPQISQKTIAVLPFVDLSTDRNYTYFSDGISEEIINGLAHLSELSVKSRTASFAYRDTRETINMVGNELGVDYLLEGSFRKTNNTLRLTARLVDTSNGDLIWSKTYSDKISTLFEAQEDIALQITRALDVYLDEERRSNMFAFGTRDVKAYEHYLRGRYLLKGWHDSFIEQDLIDANAEFRAAVVADPAFAKAYFHNVDIYYHLAKGDISTQNAITLIDTQMAARDRIFSLLDLALQHAADEEDKAQYRVNRIFFSDNWTGLREAAIEFGEIAAQGKGELEWEFGPVALLLTGQTEILQTLVKNRVLAHDPLNGTAHSYAIRADLLNGDFEAAAAELHSASATTFSHRLDEVRGYLLFAKGEEDELANHVQEAEYLSPILKEYFGLLAAQQELRNDLLLASEQLARDDVQRIFAHLHTGQPQAARDLMDQVLNEPLGTVLFPVVLAYGAGCGLNPLPKNERLEQRFREAKITSIPCIGKL